jgi:Protein of unknown function (DUF3631)
MSLNTLIDNLELATERPPAYVRANGQRQGAARRAVAAIRSEEPDDGPLPDTDALLSDLQTFIERYVRFPDDFYALAVTLWVAMTHVRGAFDTAPRLHLQSAEKESGKSRCLEVLELLVAKPLAVMNTTIAAIFRLLAEERATPLLDEVDAIFGPKAREHEDLRALLNAGYRRGAEVARVVGEGSGMKVKRFPVYAPVALASIGELPDTITSRAITVPMRRRAPDEPVEGFRRRKAAPVGDELRCQLERWGAHYESLLEESDPAMPEGVTDRAADCWEPLLAIADLAGGEWPAKAREAALTIVSGRIAEDQSTGVRLLADIRAVMEGQDRISSAALIAKLNALEESGWGGWHDGKGIGPRDLSKKLKAYNVRPKTVRFVEGTLSGYVREDLADPWTRYLREPVESFNRQEELV